MISIKTEEDLKRIRQACKIVARVLKKIENEISDGVSTLELDRFAEELIVRSGARPAFKGYRGYRFATCISVNEQIVHGIPSKRRLKKGDLVGVDVGAEVDGYFGDGAKTFSVGPAGPDSERMMSAAKDCLKLGIAKARAGGHLGDIGQAIQRRAESGGYSVVRDLFGHGIGKALHEDPLIPNFGRAGDGPELKAGMVFAIEPMLNAGTHKIDTLQDGWTVVTADRELSVHYEHTILVTDGEPEILTAV